MAAQSNLKAAFWMACSLSCLLLMTLAGRESTREINVFQVMEMRSIIGMAMLYPLIRMSGGFRAMATKRPLLHLGRNIGHYAGQASWLHALSLIPIAQLISIEFTAPIWAAIIAVTLLGERLTWWRIAAIASGLAGVLIVVRPGTSFDAGQLFGLLAAVMFAISYTTTKSLTRTESVVAIIFWMLLMQSAIGIVPALAVWQWPSAAIWPWIVLIAFAGSYAHYCMARALVHADVTVVMPMDFLRVPLSALMGWALYAERIDLFTLAGGAVILAGNTLNLFGRKPPVPAEVAN